MRPIRKTPHGTRCRPRDTSIARVVVRDDIREIRLKEASRLASMHGVGLKPAPAVLGAHLAAGGVVGAGRRDQVAVLGAATSEARAVQGRALVRASRRCDRRQASLASSSLPGQPASFPLRLALAPHVRVGAVIAGAAQRVPPGRKHRPDRVGDLHRAKLFPRSREVYIVPELKVAGLVRLAAHRRDRTVEVEHLHVRRAAEQRQGCGVVVINAGVEIRTAAATSEGLWSGAVGCRRRSGRDQQDLAARSQRRASRLVDDAEVLDILCL